MFKYTSYSLLLSSSSCQLLYAWPWQGRHSQSNNQRAASVGRLLSLIICLNFLIFILRSDHYIFRNQLKAVLGFGRLGILYVSPHNKSMLHFPFKLPRVSFILFPFSFSFILHIVAVVACRQHRIKVTIGLFCGSVMDVLGNDFALFLVATTYDV